MTDVNVRREKEEEEKEEKVEEISSSKTPETEKPRKGKSCKGTLYYSSQLRSKSRNPRCVGFTRSLQQVPSYIVSESEVEASKEGRSLTNFTYTCIGYSIYLDKIKDSPPTGDQKPRAELPVCVGIELLVDKRPADQPAHAQNKEDNSGLPQHQPPKIPHPVGEEFLNRFTRNAGLVASGVAKNMRKVGNYVKESIDDIIYRRPK